MRWSLLLALLLIAPARADRVSGQTTIAGKTFKLQCVRVARHEKGFYRVLLLEREPREPAPHVDPDQPYLELAFWFQGEPSRERVSLFNLSAYADGSGNRVTRYSWPGPPAPPIVTRWELKGKTLRVASQGQKVKSAYPNEQPITWSLDLQLDLP